MGAWIYQINPAKFDIDGCLNEAPERVLWITPQHQRDLTKGDQVFIWRSHPSAKERGIIAEGAVDSLVEKTPSDPFTARFSRESNPDNGNADRVWLRIVAIAADNSAITADELSRHELLKQVGPLEFHAKTVYAVSADESRELNSLWRDRRKRSKP